MYGGGWQLCGVAVKEQVVCGQLRAATFSRGGGAAVRGLVKLYYRDAHLFLTQTSMPGNVSQVSYLSPHCFQCPILYITPYSLNLQTLPVTHAYPWAGRLLPPIYSHTMEILPLTLTQSTNHSTYSSLPMDWKGGVLPGPDHRAMPLHRPP